MPEQREAALYESGRATAPPGVCYTSLSGSTSEGYTHTVAIAPASTNLTDQNHPALAQSPLYTPNYTNFAHQRPQASPHYSANYSPCPSPSPNSTFNYSSAASKSSSSNLPFHSPQYTPNYSSSSHTYSTFSSSTFSNCSNSSNNNFDFPTTSKNPSKSTQPSCFNQENSSFSSTDQSSNLFTYPKIPKTNSNSTPKYTPNYANFSYFSNNQSKYTQESVNLCSEKNLKYKKDCEVNQKSLRTFKDDTEVNYNFGELHQFLSKHTSKIKSTQEANQELVTDSLLHFLQKKTQERNPQDSLSYDLGDISQILVSLTSKYKTEEVSGLKKKDNNEDSKLMNDILTKLILEKEEKKFKSFDDKKKNSRKEIFDDLNNELDEKKIKRDAMSHYQEDKNHHKRSSNYGEFNQWDYLNQQEIQNSSNHNRRSHFSFGGTSQPHSMGWNQMGMGMPRQTNPYYSNPHSHVMPAHAHVEYLYNQWNNPNHKNVPNIHNAHSQNTALSQVKHLGDISNPVQDFGLNIGSTADLSKLRTSPLIRTPPPSEKPRSTGSHPDHLATISSALRNSSSLRTPPLPTHPKSVINNPLSDLQMLVTNQDKESPPQKLENYQQESVDLSAHSEALKQKENLTVEEEKPVNDIRKNISSPVSVIQTQSKQVRNDVNDSEKPVELTSKNTEMEISSSVSVNNLNNEHSFGVNSAENKKETVPEVKDSEESVKTSVIVEQEGDVSVSNTGCEEGIQKDVQNNVKDAEQNKVPEKEEMGRENQETKITYAQDLDNTVEKAKPSSELVVENEAEKIKEKSSADTGLKEDKEITENAESCKRKTEEKEVESENKKICLEVESRLEKMFEGITEENSDLPTVSSTSAEVKSISVGNSKKTPKKKPRKSRAARLSSGHSSSSESHFPSKKFRSVLSKDHNRKKLKKSLCDVMDRRGPFLHIEGSKESPSSVIVVNFPKGDDEDEKDKNFVKKQTSNSARTKHHNELDYRGKSRNGLFSSTLSARYDAHTTDHTWVCVFCKKGPHYNTLGDLFGPYIISNNENTSLCDFSGDEKDISDAQKRGGRNKKSLRSNNMVEHFQKMSRKLRRTQSGESCLTGMTVISDEQIDVLRYEVWVHEQCAIWSPNVCLIGSRIIGMQEAIWNSVKTMCSKCGIFGANIGCVFRNCPNRCHYPCAKDSGWSLEQKTFISTCQIHKPRS